MTTAVPELDCTLAKDMTNGSIFVVQDKALADSSEWRTVLYTGILFGS